MLHLNNDDATKGMISEEYLPIAVDYHKSVFDFAKRPLTTKMIESVSQGMDVTIADSFVLVNFLFLLCNGLLLYLLSVRHFCHWKYALFNVAFYYLSYSILFSFFPPVYSYDEPAQYFFIFCMLICFFEKWTVLFILSSFMAMMARETSGLILLGLFICKLKTSNISRKDILIFAIPVILYVLFLIYYVYTNNLLSTLQNDTKMRGLAFRTNFADNFSVVESFFAIINTSLVALYFLFRIRQFSDSKIMRLREVLLIIFILNTAICLLFTLAREARLFNLPFVFFYPFAYIILIEIRLSCSILRCQEKVRQWSFWVILTAGLASIYFISMRLFKTSSDSPSDNLFNEYSFFMLSGLLLFALLAKRNTDVQKHTHEAGTLKRE